MSRDRNKPSCLAAQHTYTGGHIQELSIQMLLSALIIRKKAEIDNMPEPERLMSHSNRVTRTTNGHTITLQQTTCATPHTPRSGRIRTTFPIRSNPTSIVIFKGAFWPCLSVCLSIALENAFPAWQNHDALISIGIGWLRGDSREVSGRIVAKTYWETVTSKSCFPFEKKKAFIWHSSSLSYRLKCMSHSSGRTFISRPLPSSQPTPRSIRLWNLWNY